VINPIFDTFMTLGDFLEYFKTTIDQDDDDVSDFDSNSDDNTDVEEYTFCTREWNPDRAEHHIPIAYQQAIRKKVTFCIQYTFFCSTQQNM
jgi:hypothetical protein